jgi:excisionase family DNA binding protein
MGGDVAEGTEGIGGTDMNQNHLMDVNEVAEFLGLAVGSIYHMVSQKRIPCVRLSARCLRFRRSDLDKHIATLLEEPAAQRGKARP